MRKWIVIAVIAAIGVTAGVQVYLVTHHLSVKTQVGWGADR